MNECPQEDHPSSKTRWMYLVAARLFCHSSRFTEQRDVTAYCISLIGAGCRFLVQPSSISGMRMPRFSTTASDNEDDDLRPADRLCTPANRYTFYMLRLVCRFRFFLCHSEYHVSLSSFVKLPVETLFLC